MTKTGVLALGVMEEEDYDGPRMGMDDEDDIQEVDPPRPSPSVTFFDASVGPGTKHGAFILPELAFMSIVSHYELSTDHAAKLAIFTVGVSSFTTRGACYVMTARFDRMIADKPILPTRDIAYFKGQSNNAVCGYRGIMLEGPIRNVNVRGLEPYRLFISDYRFSDMHADVVHAAPLGCRTASSVPPKPAPRRRQQIKYRRNNYGGRKIDFEWSEAWDGGISKGTRITDPMVPDWNMTAYGCPRVAVEIGLDQRRIKWIEADAGHLYICTVSVGLQRLIKGFGSHHTIVLMGCIANLRTSTDADHWSGSANETLQLQHLAASSTPATCVCQPSCQSTFEVYGQNVQNLLTRGG